MGLREGNQGVNHPPESGNTMFGKSLRQVLLGGLCLFLLVYEAGFGAETVIYFALARESFHGERSSKRKKPSHIQDKTTKP